MSHKIMTSRRDFLKGAMATSAFGLAGGAFQIGGLSMPPLQDTATQTSTYPDNRVDATLPEIGSAIVLHTPRVVKNIAPDTPYELWTFGGTAPGPALHVAQGEKVNFTMVNEDEMPHSIDFHAAQVPWDKYYQAVNPGDTLSFDFTPAYPGVFMYHCGTNPVLMHIANGMHGLIVVEPENGWPEPAREYALVQEEWYLLDDKTDQGFYQGDFSKMLTVQPKFVTFNGFYNQYVDAPLTADPGELIRIHVCNAGPTIWSAFHVIGAIFEATYPSGNPANKEVGMQTVSIPPGSAYMVELRIPDEGMYPLVTHSFAYTGIGALGFIKVGNPTT